VVGRISRTSIALIVLVQALGLVARPSVRHEREQGADPAWASLAALSVAATS